MAFPAEPPAPPRPARPTTVSAAVLALYALAATQIISAILTIVALGPTVDATRDYVEGTPDGDAIVSGTQIFSYVGIAFGLIFAIAFAVLAVFVNRGSQPARIVAWVMFGLSLCCSGFGLLGTAASGLGGGSSNGIDQEELARRIEDSVPGWIGPFNYLLLAIMIIASIAGIILLALPASHPYFRKTQPTWEPPVPGGYYPDQPGQPGQQGGGPGAPGNPPPAF